MNRIHSLIRTNYHMLSDAQKRVADLFLSETKDVVMMTLADIAKRADTSETTILRFLKKLGFESYPTFRVQLAGELSVNGYDPSQGHIRLSDSLDEAKDKLINRTAQAILDLDNAIHLDVLEKLAANIVKAKRVLIIGVGPSSPVTMELCSRLLRLGISAVATSDPHIINMSATSQGPEDLTLAVSHSGQSREIIDGAKLSKDRGATLAVITSHKQSALAHMADILLLSSSYEKPDQIYGMVSRILQMVLVDLIYVTVLKELGEDSKDYLIRARESVKTNLI